MTDTSLLQDMLVVAQNAARAAGTFQKQKWATEFQVEFKSEINLVTEVDKMSEQMIIDAIVAQYPDHDVLAEEGFGKRKDSIYKWIIDPLDGTTNFAHGYPLWCVSIALECRGDIILGVVYDPLKDEMFSACRGGGAFLNGKPIRVSNHDTLSKSLLATGFAYNVRETTNNNLDHFATLLMKAQSVRRDGVAAIDLCYVACGRYDGYWELNLFPWDMAAGLLILQEAGGRVTRFNGAPFGVYDKEICATNTKIHPQLVDVLMSEKKS